MLRCLACRQENPEIARFCLSCGAPLAPAPPPEEERRIVTALFTDIVGSTAAAEALDPEDVRARLTPYYARLRTELERHGGTVEKFIGDAVVALFGAPVEHEDDPERAVHAALAITTAIEDLNAQDEWLDLRIRTAVHTGEALVVLGARAAEGEAMAAGDVMNTAARLQSAAPVNGVVVGEETFRSTRGVFEFRSLEPIAAKGKTEPVPVWEVVGLRSTPAASDTGLVGRAAELARVLDVWRRVGVERRPHLVTVVGAPGVGKSRLVRELVAEARREGRVLRGRCLAYGEGITYWPIAELLKDASGILQSDDADVGAEKLDRFLEGLPTHDREELRTVAAAAANLLGVERTPRGTYGATEISQGELHWGVRRTFELLACEQPLVLVVEDLHWAEPTLLELLRAIADTAEAPLLIVGSARPELVEESPPLVHENEHRHVVLLESLTREDARALLLELARPTELPESLVEKVLDNAGGNPLFVEESVRMLLDERLLAPERAATLELLPVPRTLQALIGSRLDRLPGDERRAAQHGSVAGAVFWTGAVAYVARSDDDLTGTLDGLVRRDVVQIQEPSTVAGEREYAFKHVLLRDVAYGRLPKGRRVELHVRFADWLSRLPGPEDEFVEIAGYHLEQSCLLARDIVRTPIEPPVRRAADALARAAERAERREGMREAERYYARALALLDAKENELLRSELRLRHGRAAAALGRLAEATQELGDVLAHARLADRLDLVGSALNLLATLDLRQGRAAQAVERLTEAGEIAATTGDPRLTIRVGFALATLRSEFEGDFEAAVDEIRRAIATAESVGDPALEREGHLRAGFVLYNMGRLAEADAALARCLELAATLGSRRDEARATYLLGLIRYYRGELDEAEALGVQAHALIGRTGESYFEVQNLIALALVALARGDAVLAEERLRAAVPVALEEGGWLVVEVYRLLTETLVGRGEIDDAAELAEFAGRSVPHEFTYARGAALMARGCVAAARGDAAAARAAYAEAVSLLEQTHMPLDLAQARIAYARVLSALRDGEGARGEYDRARAAAVEVGAAALVAEIDRDLAAGRTARAGTVAGPRS